MIGFTSSIWRCWHLWSSEPARAPDSFLASSESPPLRCLAHVRSVSVACVLLVIAASIV